MKHLVIMRGPQGSGKSTLAQQIFKDSKAKSKKILATDDFFTKEDGSYIFIPGKLKEAHKWNIDRCKSLMQIGTELIIVDNTNITVPEAAPYADLAYKHEYTYDVQEPQTPWVTNIDELARRNLHGVPKEVIARRLESYRSKPHSKFVEELNTYIQELSQ